jgi:2-dehydro-3-deoxygalactonokinase
MRGEETQILGALEQIGERGLACLPGTHSKWARVEHGRITAFSTHMTGEVFAALRGATILGRTMRDAPPNEETFDQGLQRSADAGGLLHHLFGVRALNLRGQLSEMVAASYLSGLLIGHEIRAALPEGEPLVHVIGAPELAGLYARAIAACGGHAVVQEGDTAATGLTMIGERARWN